MLATFGPASTSASHACGSTSLSLGVMISVDMAAARSAPRSEPAKSHDFLPNANPRRARSAALFVRRWTAIGCQILLAAPLQWRGRYGVSQGYGCDCHHDRTLSPQTKAPRLGGGLILFAFSTLLRLSQADPGATPVFVNELDARCFQCAPNGQVVRRCH